MRRWWMNHAWGTVLANYIAYGVLFAYLDVPYWGTWLACLFVGQQIVNHESHLFAEWVHRRDLRNELREFRDNERKGGQ